MYQKIWDTAKMILRGNVPVWIYLVENKKDWKDEFRINKGAEISEISKNQGGRIIDNK